MPVDGDEEASGERDQLVDSATNLVLGDGRELNARSRHAALELEHVDVAVLRLRLVWVHHCRAYASTFMDT